MAAGRYGGGGNEFRQAISDDPDVKLAAKNLALMAMREAAFLLANGSPTAKMHIIKSLLPAIANSLKEREQDDAMVTMQQEFQSLVEEVFKD